MKLCDLPNLSGKTIRAITKDGEIVEGRYSGFENRADSDDERESIFIAFDWYDEQIYVDEIDRVEVV